MIFFDKALTVDLTASFSLSDKARYLFNKFCSSLKTYIFTSSSSKNSDKEMPKAPHFCKIVVRPYARYVHNDDTYPEKRHKVVFEWIRMSWDFEYINKYRY